MEKDGKPLVFEWVTMMGSSVRLKTEEDDFRSSTRRSYSNDARYRYNTQGEWGKKYVQGAIAQKLLTLPGMHIQLVVFSFEGLILGKRHESRCAWETDLIPLVEQLFREEYAPRPVVFTHSKT